MRALADYKRVVSYIYQYDNQVKNNNVGFARIETRGDQCKITIHMRVSQTATQSYQAYLYCWYKNQLRCIPIGTIVFEAGIGDLKVVSDPQHLMSTDYTMQDMSGIIVPISDHKFLGTQWDDREIKFKEFVIDREKQSEETKHPFVVLPGEKKFVQEEDVKAAETVVQQVQPEQEEVHIDSIEEEEIPITVEEQVEESTQTEEMEQQEMQVEPDSYEESQEVTSYESQEYDSDEENDEMEDSQEYSDSSEESMDILDEQAREYFSQMLQQMIDNSASATAAATAVEEEQQQEENTEASSIPSYEESMDYDNVWHCSSDEEYEEIQVEIMNLENHIKQLEQVAEEWKNKSEELKKQEMEKLEYENQIREEMHLNEKLYGDEEEGELHQQSLDSNQNLFRPSSVISRIFAKYPKITPFSDKRVVDCIKLDPQDLGIFPMENWILANNSFLLHGYYSYRHLIFVKMKKEKGYEYLLGVPGVNHSREQFMAKMFGFDRFQCLSNQEAQPGDFGYWCLNVKM